MSDKTTPWTHHSFHFEFGEANKTRNALVKNEGYAEPKEGNLKQAKVRRRTAGKHEFEVITRAVSPTHYVNLRTSHQSRSPSSVKTVVTIRGLEGNE